MLKQALLLGTVGLLLAGCGLTGTKDQAVGSPEQQEETLEADQADGNYFVDDIQTSFAVEPTILPRLSAEEMVLAQEITNKVSEAFTVEPGEEPKYMSEQGIIETFAHEYPGYSVDDLLYLHHDGATLRMFKGTSDRYYMDPSDYMTLERHVFEANVKRPFDSIHFISGGGGTGRYHSYYDYSGKLEIEGQEVPYSIRLEFSEDYREATLTELTIDGEDAFE